MSGLRVTLDVSGPGSPPPPGVDLTAYRIVQEGLTNVFKHGGLGAAVVDDFDCQQPMIATTRTCATDRRFRIQEVCEGAGEGRSQPVTQKTLCFRLAPCDPSERTSSLMCQPLTRWGSMPERSSV